MICDIINAETIKPKKYSVTLHEYQLRIYGGELGPSKYFRNRKSGQNPVIITKILGKHPPKWMLKMQKSVNEQCKYTTSFIEAKKTIEEINVEQNFYRMLW